MNPSTALGRTLVDELVRCGVAEVVLAPGSRSAPLAMALHAAAEARRLRLHVRIDERSAGFLALGLARTSGVAAVVTTSGTAVANLHPAVLEAHLGGVALVVVSADRPGELRGVGANQTIDQVGIFGGSVRHTHDMPAPDIRPGQVAYWRSTVSRAVLAAQGVLTSDPGPVHLNVAFREPLVPDGDDAWDEPLDGRPSGAPWTAAAPVEAALVEAAGSSGELAGLPDRTLLVVGEAPVAAQRAAFRLADRRGWPAIAEPGARAGQSTAVDCGPLVLSAEAWLTAHRPDHVLVVGRPTLSRTVTQLLRSASAVSLVGRADWPDAVHAVESVYPAVALEPGGDMEHGHAAGGSGDPAFVAAWRKAGERARVAVDEVLSGLTVPTSLAATKAVIAALPAESMVYLGSSSVIRDVDLVGGPELPARVLANRGVSGIDGTVSSAVGAALGTDRVAGGVPAYAVIGDLTFLHDANGLVIGPDEPKPDLCIVVVNDDGGGIFALLEQGAPEHAASFERVFGTPHGVDLGALCAATKTPHQLVTLDEIPAAVAPRPGLRVVEVAVDRSGHREIHAQLRDAVAAALSRA